MNVPMPPSPPPEREVKDGSHFGYRPPAPSAFEDIGPSAPNRVVLYRKAREVQELARMAEEYATPGARLDLARSERTLDRIRHVLGVGQGYSWGRLFTILLLIFVCGGVNHLAGDVASNWFAGGIAFAVFYVGALEYLECRGGGQ